MTATPPIEPDKRIRETLEFEHKQLVEIIKSMLSGFYQIAPSSFLLNSTLLGAIAFLTYQRQHIPTNLLGYGRIFVGLIVLLGLVYNVGALCSVTSSTLVVKNLLDRFVRVDADLGLKIGVSRTTISRTLSNLTFVLTLVFFALWIALWAFLVWFNFKYGIITSPRP